jgi:hypothetical protein
MITNWVKNTSGQYRGYIVFLSTDENEKGNKEEVESYYDYFMSFFWSSSSS